MKLTNLFISFDAIRIGIALDGQVLKDREADAEPGVLLVTGKARKGAVSLRVSQVVRNHLEDITELSKEAQLQILQRVKQAIARLRTSVVFLYEAAWKRATLRSELGAQHRLHTLPQEVQGRHRRAGRHAMYQLGARALVSA
jgi:hypothetical protein